MPFVNVKGVKTHYYSKGEGKKHHILFIHGSGRNHTMWKAQVDHLGAKYHAMTIDLMGHGESEIVIDPFLITIKTYTDFVNDFLGALNIKKIILCGMSLGGGICIQFCLDYPEKIECLGLINTGAKLGVNPELLSKLRKDFRKRIEDGVTSSIDNQKERVPPTRPKKRALETDPAVALADWEACNKFDSRDRISEIKKPTIIIGGSEDVMTPVWFHTYLHEKLENSTIKIIKGAGHATMLQKPKEVNMILSDFLEKNL